MGQESTQGTVLNACQRGLLDIKMLWRGKTWERLTVENIPIGAYTNWLFILPGYGFTQWGKWNGECSLGATFNEQ